MPSGGMSIETPGPLNRPCGASSRAGHWYLRKSQIIVRDQVGWPGQRVVRAAKPQEAHQEARHPAGAGLVPGPLVASRPGQHVVRATQVITMPIVRSCVDTNA